MLYVTSRVTTNNKIRKGYSEAVNRRTDNTMAKRKGTTHDVKNIAQKTKD
jgi:hypothetical protein